MQLPEYEFQWKDGAPPDDDLLDFDDMNKPTYNTDEVPDNIVDYYWSKLEKAYFKDKQKIKEQALAEGIKIIDNGGKIADATRQCVNSRIQGSAADLTKLAMIKLNNNAELKKLGFKLLIPVHDEVIAECPQENVKKCSKLLAEVMSKAAEEILKMPIKCDVTCTKEWYGEEVQL
jgi:DNA polymerase I-like protein with 3'-5' exonuclease and polymerase domains